ncbi:electron transporter RnfC [Pseudodesulfovibrio sp.]|uniref:electron transporter RnfC n=1 Tax=Pseudodesulfovibrio sp. TaxID=2035812 RepID=UPI0026158A3D|nr:electron transporter RnfC [Pseudodesulfovibrio sp.]MDD3310641.1 electron transporter RnfC [Pseudodesulfovibrio sp.]
MTTFSFSLLTGETGPLVKEDRPDRLNIPTPYHTPVLAAGDQVLAGTRIATADRPGDGDLHSPLSGTITEITPYAIGVRVEGDDRAEAAEPAPDGGNRLREWLRAQGVDVRGLNRAAALIINAVPHEPGISVCEPLLRDYRKTVELGLDAVQRIVEPSKMFLVSARGNQTNAFANCSVVHIAPVHPNGMDPMVIKKVTGKETLPGRQPENTALVSVKALYLIGRIMETGRPLTETVMTIGGQNHLVPVGTPAGFLAAAAGATVQPGDRIVLGGLMCGLPARDLAQGVDKETSGLNLIRSGEGLEPTDNPCLGCGECERHCPARLMPGMLSRCAEFKQFKRAEAFHVHSCIECGICGYWCVAQRPLLHYIRLAKYEISLLAAEGETETATTAKEER